jgi:transposase
VPPRTRFYGYRSIFKRLANQARRRRPRTASFTDSFIMIRLKKKTAAPEAAAAKADEVRPARVRTPPR